MDLRTTLIFLFIFWTWTARSQSVSQLLAAGEMHYDHERYDSAFLYFQWAYDRGLTGEKLQAAAGWIMTAVTGPEKEEIGVWLSRGDSLANLTDNPLHVAVFEIARGEHFRAKADFKNALALQQRAYSKTKSLRGNSLLPAYALLYTAANLERLARPDSSFAYANQALELFRQQLDSTDVKYATIYNLLGNSYYRMSRFDAAEEFYRKAAQISEEAIGPTSESLSVCLSNLANISRMKQNYEQAIAFSERALGIKKMRKDTAGMSSDYYSLGVFHYFTGDYGRARDYLDACIRIRETIYDSLDYRLADPYEVMGIVHEQAGDYQTTLHYFKKAQQNKTTNFGPANLLVGYNMENIALLYQKLDQPDSALHYIRQANAILTDQLPTGHYALGTHYYSLANILMENRQWKAARRALEQSNRIFHHLRLDQSPEFILNTTGQARLEAAVENWEKADEGFELALQAIRTPQFPAPYRTDPVSLDVLNQYLDYLYLKYRKTGDKEFIEAFFQTADAFRKTSEHFRRQFSDPYTKSVIAKGNTQVYRRITGILTNLYLKEPREGLLEQIYRMAESSRTSALRDQLDARIKSFAGIPDHLLQQEREWKREINRLQEQLLEFPDSSDLQTELLELEARFEDYVEDLTTAYPRYYDLRFQERILPLDAIRKEIGERQTIIQYIADDTTYYALIIQKHRNELVRLGPKGEIDRLVREYRRRIQSADTGFRQISHTLYQKLWVPLDPHLSGNEVIIIPVDALHYINHDNLLTETGRYLIQDYTFSYALSVYDLYSSPLVNSPPGVRNLTFSPGFEDVLKEAYLRSLDTLTTPDEAYLKTVRQPWCLRLSRTLQEQFQFDPLTGAEATEEKIRKVIGEGRILNFATHAFADALDPLRSKIVLAKDPSGGPEDGYLHTFEIYGLNLNADLTVLGACESGIGNLRDGEGMISLAYGMKYAGTPNTIMTLWKVDEKVNATLMEAFFDQLAAGKSMTAALRAAKLDYLATAEPPLSHPFYWSGLVFNGRDTIVPLERRSAATWWLGLSGLLLIGGILVGLQFFRK